MRAPLLGLFSVLLLTNRLSRIAVLFIRSMVFFVQEFLIVFFFQRHGQGREISVCETEFEGKWKENRKHGTGTKKLKNGRVEGQVSIVNENELTVCLPYILHFA